MLDLLKIRINGFKLLKENFEIDLTTKARVYESDKAQEIQEVDKGLYLFHTNAFVGGNSSGKSTSDRTHLPQLGNYHRSGDDDILLHLLYPLLPKNLQRSDAAEGDRQQCAYGDALLLCLRAARHLCG